MRPAHAIRSLSHVRAANSVRATPLIAPASWKPLTLLSSPSRWPTSLRGDSLRPRKCLKLDSRRYEATPAVPAWSSDNVQKAELSGSKQAPAHDATPSKKPVKTPSKLTVGELRRLMSLAKPEQKTLTMAIGLLLVSSAVSLSVPFTLGKIIDLFTSPEKNSLPISIGTAAALLTGIFLIGAAANVGRSILMRLAGQRIVAGLRRDAYASVLRKDIGWFDLQGQGPLQDPAVALARLQAAAAHTPEHTENVEEKHEEDQQAHQPAHPEAGADEATRENRVRGTGDIISRLGADASIVGESITRELSEGLRSAITSVFGLAVMLYISTKLTAVMLLVVPPSAIGAVIYGRYVKKLSRKTQKAVGEMTHVAEERIGGIRTVQAFNAAEIVEPRRFNERVDTILDLARKEAYATGLYFGGTGFAGNLTLLALLTYGGSLVARGSITVGDLSSMVLYTAYVGGSLYGLTSFYSTIMKGLGASSRLFELLDAKSVAIELGVGRRLLATDPQQPIKFDNVTFSYPSRPTSEILRGLSLTIQPGQSVALAGGSGSGKTSVANLLLRFYDPAQGSIYYGNEKISAFTPESWRERIAIVPQDPALFSDTIAENIRYGNPSASMSEVREAARLANCDFIHDLPDGFETQVGVRAARLSGGQRQRLAIARALVRNPSILVLDEATSALDGTSEALVNEAVRKVTASRSLTTILIAHRLSTLRTADRIIFLENGHVSEQGTFRELSREGTRFEMHVRSQLLGRSSSSSTKGSSLDV